MLGDRYTGNMALLVLRPVSATGGGLCIAYPELPTVAKGHRWNTRLTLALITRHTRIVGARVANINLGPSARLMAGIRKGGATLKNPKRPTRKQKELLARRRLSHKDWLVTKNPPGELHLVHRSSGDVKVLRCTG